MGLLDKKTIKEKKVIAEEIAKEVVEQEKKVILSAEQQRISALVESSKADFSDVKITDYIRRIEMEIPKVVKKSEYAYRWIWVGNLDKELINMGGIFEIVNRTNHSNVPSKLFGITGAITYKGENILCFTKRDLAKGIATHEIGEFNKKTDRAVDSMQDYGGGKIQIERSEVTEGGSSEVELMADKDYDAGDPT